MKILSNIRAKVWGCVIIALIAYLFATISSSVSNTRLASNLTHIAEVHFPMALKGEKVLTLFKEQTEHYENGLLTGDEDEILKANNLDREISKLLDELVNITSSRHKEFYPRLLALRDSYEDYFGLASEKYLKALHSAEPFSSVHELRRIGKLREVLSNDFLLKSRNLTETVVHEIENEKLKATNNTQLLHALFLIVLVIITIVINLVANRQLIMPLKKIKAMIDNYSRGKNIPLPESSDEGDEINSLALSFWRMTEKLEKISVSKNFTDSIIQNMSDCLIVLSPSLKIKKINRSTTHLISYSEKDLIDLPVRDIISPSGESPFIQTFFDELLQGKSISNFEMTLQAKSGDTIPVLLSGAPLYQENGAVEGIICLARDIRQFKEEVKKREIRINFDELTNLPNRNLLLDRLKQGLNEAKRYQRTMAFLLLTIEFCADENELLAVEEENLIIQETARRLCHCVRETDTVARMKENEFAIILSKLGRPEDAELVAQKIIDEVSSPLTAPGTGRLCASIGITFHPTDGSTTTKLIKNADIALQQAQVQGGDCFVLFQPTMEA